VNCTPHSAINLGLPKFYLYDVTEWVAFHKETATRKYTIISYLCSVPAYAGFDKWLDL